MSHLPTVFAEKSKVCHIQRLIMDEMTDWKTACDISILFCHGLLKYEQEHHASNYNRINVYIHIQIRYVTLHSLSILKPENIYIYMNGFGRRFYPKELALHSCILWQWSPWPWLYCFKLHGNAISRTEEAHWSLPRPWELPTYRLRLFKTSEKLLQSQGH